MTQGLYHEREMKIRRAREKRLLAASPDALPRDRHEAEVDADQLTRESVDLGTMILQGQSLINDIDNTLTALASFKRTRLRALAITDLEQAQDRLRRELGDAETPPKETAKSSPPTPGTPPSCTQCYGMGWVPSKTDTDTDPCPKCQGGFSPLP